MSIHTPGPWRRDGNRIVAKIDDDEESQTIADLAQPWREGQGYVSMDEVNATGHLIAAAPDLLEAAILTVSNVLDVGYVTGPTIDKLRAAIAKAEAWKP